MIYGDVNICHAVVDENGYIKYIGTRCHERRKGYATNLINELKLEFESLTCKTNKMNKVANKLFKENNYKIRYKWGLFFLLYSQFQGLDKFI